VFIAFIVLIVLAQDDAHVTLWHGVPRPSALSVHSWPLARHILVYLNEARTHLSLFRRSERVPVRKDKYTFGHRHLFGECQYIHDAMFGFHED
jgi:hypothetical protein